MRAREHITSALAAGVCATFIDELGRPRLAHPPLVSTRTVRACAARDPRRTKVTLEVDPAAEPIAGDVQDGQGARRRFTGWLGLLAALDRALAAGRAERRVDHRSSAQTELGSRNDE